MIQKLALVACGLLVLSACSFGPQDDEFPLSSLPEDARCLLRGQNGFSAEVQTPGNVQLPPAAHPVDVRCFLPGYRTAFGFLRRSGGNWSWVPVASSVILEPEQPRALTIIERVAGQPLKPRPTW